MRRNNRTYLPKLILSLLLISLVSGCVGKRPDDDVALIKQVLGEFERGIRQTSRTVLDSVVLDKQQGLSAQLLDSLSMGRKLEGGGIAQKSFVIVGDSAEVKLRLNIRYVSDAEEPDAVEKPIKLFLHKKKGKWRIRSFSMLYDENKPEDN